MNPQELVKNLNQASEMLAKSTETAALQLKAIDPKLIAKALEDPKIIEAIQGMKKQVEQVKKDFNADTF